MPCVFEEKKVIPYRTSILYEIVADVASYPSFLPGCLEAHILEQNQDFIRAKLVIGYGLFKEAYVSKVFLTPFSRIEVMYESGPFQYLENFWNFKRLSEDETEVHFFIDFAFRSRFLQKMIEGFFQQGATSLMKAFEERAAFLSS